MIVWLRLGSWDNPLSAVLLAITCDSGIPFYGRSIENFSQQFSHQSRLFCTVCASLDPQQRLNVTQSAIYINKQSLKIKWKIDVIEMCRSSCAVGRRTENIENHRRFLCGNWRTAFRVKSRVSEGGKLSQTQIWMWVWLNCYLINYRLNSWVSCCRFGLSDIWFNLNFVNRQFWCVFRDD